MATFPALIPSTRTYSPGEYPHTPHPTYNGSQARVRHSNAVMGARLRLFFPALTTSEMLEIKAHYAGQRGGFVSFIIPDELLSGTDDPRDFTPVGHRWRYAARPKVVDISVDGDTPSNFHDVTVELVSTPEKPVVHVPRVVYRLTALAPEVIGTPSSVDVPAVAYSLTPLAPTVEAAAGASDPDFSSVSLLLLGDGTNGSTTIIDSSSLGLTMTAEGNAQISTAQSKFSPSSIAFDGTGDRVITPDDNALDFPSNGLFTLEGWIRSAVDPSTYSAQYAHLFGKGNGGNAQYECALYLSKATFAYSTVLLNGTTTVIANQWYHVAVTRDSSQVIRLFLDGNLEASTTDGTALTSTRPFTVGDREAGDPGGQYPFNGFIEQVRVTKGVARYTSGFTPPPAPFPTS